MKRPRKYRPGVPPTFFCPYCMGEFPMDEILFKSGQRVVPGARSILRRLLNRPPVPPDRHQLWQVVCPNEKCTRILPPATASNQSLVIGLVGASESGKTSYVGALIKQLHEDVGARFGAALMPLDTETAARFATEFQSGMFRNHMPPQCSLGMPSPMIYNLILPGERWGEKEPRSVTLALYDSAGENFENEDRVRNLVGYLRIAAGIILIVDPLQSTGIRELLTPTGRHLPNVRSSNCPTALISRVLKELEANAIVKGGHRFSIPMAVTLTKCDELMGMRVIDPRSRWAGPEVHEGIFNAALHTELESTIRQVFQWYEPSAYQLIRNWFTNHAFFGVSATGCSPDPRTGRYPSVSPWRVEEPLLWLLSQLGVLPAKPGPEH